jgi:hypothetical protein
MADEQPRQQIANLQAKLKNLHMQMQIGSPTAPKDLSSVSLILKWAGTAKSIPAYEYFEGSERSAKVGKSSDANKIDMSVLKLMDAAKGFIVVV